MELDVGVAHQKIIRDKMSKTDRSPIPSKIDIQEAVCRMIDYQTAKKVILEYEWLGTMGLGMYCYGIFFEDILGGVVCFGLPAGKTSGDICGVENRDKAICLERGACVHWAHPHSASKLISYAVNDMAKNTKYRIFFAYSDDSAGEIGTVYQACNWYYLGRMASGGSQNKLVTPDGELRSSRHIREYASKYVAYPVTNDTEGRKILLENGWSNKKTKPKCKYVIFKGDKREVRDLKRACRYSFKEYPKRKREEQKND